MEEASADAAQEGRGELGAESSPREIEKRYDHP